MQKQTTVTPKKVFSEVLANVAFAFIEEDDPEPQVGDSWFETTIGYTGRHQGRLSLRYPSAFARLIAANLLGVDPNDAGAQSKMADAVNELMNMVCGQLTTDRYGTSELFEQSIPETTSLKEMPDLEASSDPETWILNVEGHAVVLEFDTDDGKGGA